MYQKKTIIKKHPSDLIENRFDIKVKYLYAKSLESNIDVHLYQFLYEYHLEKWNQFKEKDEDFGNTQLYVKNNFEDFVNSFKDTLLSIKKTGFDSTLSIIPVVDNYPINGSHRITAGLLYNCEVLCEEITLPKIKYYNEEYFISLGTSKDYIDFINEQFTQQYNSK
jgi:hypothetical protein